MWEGASKSPACQIGNRLVRFDATQTHNSSPCTALCARARGSQADTLHAVLVPSWWQGEASTAGAVSKSRATGMETGWFPLRTHPRVGLIFIGLDMAGEASTAGGGGQSLADREAGNPTVPHAQKLDPYKRYSNDHASRPAAHQGQRAESQPVPLGVIGLHGTKPCTGGYMVATWSGQEKTPLPI